MPKFKTGDVCVIRSDPKIPADIQHWIGREATLLGFIGEHPQCTGFADIWKIDVQGITYKCYASESILRLKKPPHEDVGSWDRITRSTGYTPPSRVYEHS